jgi:hypothetical protein
MTLKLLIIHHSTKGYSHNVEPLTIRGKNLHDEYQQLINILTERSEKDIPLIIPLTITEITGKDDE